MIDFKKNIIEGAHHIHDTEVSFDFDRTKYANASEIGGCIRRQWYEKHGGKENKGHVESWGYANRGRAAEQYVVECMQMSGLSVRYAGIDGQISLQDPATKISATPDGVIVGNKDWAGIEIKSIDPRTNKKKNLPRSYHIDQLQISMKLMKDQMMIDLPCEGGWLIYIDASDYDDILQFWVGFDDNILTKLERRAAKILRAKSVKSLDREGRKTGDCTRFGCPYTDTCGVELPASGGRAKANRRSKMDDAVGAYLVGKQQEAEGKAVIEEQKEIIKAELKKRKTNSLSVDGHTVELAVVAGRASWKDKPTTEDKVGVMKYKQTGKPSERLTIK